MTIRSSNIGAGENVLYWEVGGASLPAWAGREMHIPKTSAGGYRSSILLAKDGAGTVAMIPKEDLDMLITAIREEGN